MKKLLLAGVFASVSFAAFAQTVTGPGASNFDALGQNLTGGGATNYADHPTGPISQSGSSSKAKGGNASLTNSGNNTATGGAGGTSRSASRATGGTATGGTSSSSGGVVNNNITTGTGNGSNGSGFGPGSWGAQTAYAPSFGSANPCAGASTSAGAQGAGFFGLSFGRQAFDVACQLNQARGNPIAMAYLCREHNEVRQAAKDIGEPCPQDRTAVVVVSAPVPNARYKFDYCYTASAGELRQHKECVAQPST